MSVISQKEQGIRVVKQGIDPLTMKRRILHLLVLCLVSLSFFSCQHPTLTEGPGSYELLSQPNKPVHIPFRMHHGKPLMDVMINDEPATLMIDNGILWDEVWLFGSPLVKELDLKPLEEGTNAGAGEGGVTSIYKSEDIKLAFENLVFYDQPLLVSPPEAGFNKMFPGADGQLCNTFFKHFIVEFDFIAQEVILHPPDRFRPYKDGCRIPMQEKALGTHEIPFSFTTLDGRVYTDSSDIDFGGIYEFKAALNNKHQITVPPNAEETVAYGASGKMTHYSGKIQSMTFGKYRFDHPTIVFGDETTSFIHPGNLGVVGLPLFMKFNIAFDYIHKYIYLEPNVNFDGQIIKE